MESEQRGRASRASSTSSLGREVRCGCQYYQSDSLLPERRALRRPPSRTMQQPPAVRCSEHEYEPIAAPSPSPQHLMYPHATMATAPVVRISDTDVMPVADSDDSIDDRARLPPELTKEGDVVLPLDGKIEDSAMEGRELVEAGDTSEELESPQELQDRLEERFLNAATPGGESRTDGEVNTSQVDSVALEELPLRRGARGLPQRLKTQAGKLRSRLRSIQRPTFAFADRQKSEKSRSTSSGKSDKSRTEKKPSRMDRIRSSFSERPRLSLPSPPKFNLPARSKFRMPQRPKFSLPERAKFHLPERPKFNIKKPNIRLPSALSRVGMSSTREKPQRSTDSTVGSHRNIFDFATYPRIFDKKSKNRSDYTTSTPKDSRAQSTESATLPRAKRAGERWSQQYDENPFLDEDNGVTAVEKSHPWRHPSLEEPRLSIRLEQQALAVARAIPWEERRRNQQEEMQYMDYEQEPSEPAERHSPPRSKETSRHQEESYEGEQTAAVGESYDDQVVKEDMVMPKDFRPVQRSRSLDEQISHMQEDESYESSFAQMDRSRFAQRKIPSEEEEYEEDIEADEEQEPSSAQSDREQQQSSGSSCDRRRRGVIEEIDSDEFFLREGGISQDDMNLGKYLTNEIRDALRSDEINALADNSMMPVPPQRPVRTRSLRKRKEGSVESYDVIPPTRPKRERARRQQSTESGEDGSRDRTRSESRHRVVYQAEGTRDTTPAEPLDDIVIVKPVRRRKSRSSQRSQSQIPTDTSTPPESKAPRPPSPVPAPPVAPARRKFSSRKTTVDQRNGDAPAMCNGFTNWTRAGSVPEKPASLPPISKESLREQDILRADAIIVRSQEEIHRLATGFQGEGYVEPAPIPPKRRSRSRGTSVAQDDDRTSHGAESLPEVGYAEDDIPDDMDSARDLSGYAVVDKREKPPRPPPPRRKRGKFATMPKPLAPKRPQRAYSTLGPSRSKDSSILSESVHATLLPAESEPYIEIDTEDAEHKAIRPGEVFSKMQGRPLPAPPRPPRTKKDHSLERNLHMMHEFTTESTIATQTDPLPDDMVIEEEITQAKLVVAPSTSGSQILVSTERIPSPSVLHAPSVPPLPVTQRLRRESQPEPGYDTVSLKSPSPIREHEDMDERPHLSAPHLEESRHMEDSKPRSVRAALPPDEPLRISSLEVGDLRVDRLSVSQIEAGKIVASEVDALLITASELKAADGSFEESLSPAIIRELMAIRSHLETVAASQAQPTIAQSVQSTEKEEKRDIPPVDTPSVREEREREEEISPAAYDRPTSVEDDRAKESKNEKVNKREVIDARDKEPVAHTLSVVRLEGKEKATTLTHTLSVPQLESENKEVPNTHALSVVQGTQDKSFQILDSGTLISLTANTAESDVEKQSGSHSMSTESREEPSTRNLGQPPSDSSHTGSTTLPLESTAHPTRGASKFDEAKIFLEDLKKEISSWEKPDEQVSSDETDKERRSSRSRSPSPKKGTTSPVRQTASPVRSLPPAISVTPDTPDAASIRTVSGNVQPQRAVISYSPRIQSQRDILIESPRQSDPCFPQGATHFIAFPASQFPTEILSLSDPMTRRIDSDQTVTDSMLQLLRVLRLTGIRAMRHFVGYMSSLTSGEESEEKIREVELTLCALLLLIAGLLIYFFSNPRIVTHHHHWDYINPPQ